MTLRKPYYKKPRRPATDKGVFESKFRNDICALAPIGCIDANSGEVTKALAVLAYQSGVIPGRGCGYEPLKDQYTIIGKSIKSGKAQDFRVEGETVAELIHVARALNGGKMEFKQDTN
jgi:hypothetical protein